MEDNQSTLYDILIIGNGPAGLSAAAHLGDSGLKVAVLSKYIELEGRFDVKGTTWETVQDMRLTDCVITAQHDFAMYSRNEKVIFKYDVPRACVIDFYKVLRTLQSRSKAEYIKCEVLEVKYGSDEVIAIDSNRKEYRAKLLIDASGNSFISLHNLGIEKPKVFYQCVSMIIEGCNIPEEKLNEMSLYMDKEVCNSSLWFYPIAKDRCQIGIGEMAPYTIASKAELHKNLLSMWNLYPYKDMLNGATTNDEHTVYCQNPVIQPIRKMQSERIMIIGDAAGMATPLVGDGVRPALYGGKEAAEVAIEAFKLQDFSENLLARHEKMWWDRLGKYYIWTMIMRHLVCLHFTSQDWDEVVKNLQRINREEFAEIISSRMTMQHCLKIMDFKITKDVLLDILERDIPHISSLSRRSLTSAII